MDWLQVKDLSELKNLGKFRAVRAEIKNFGGKTIHVSGRSWEELFESIKAFQKMLQQLNLSECKESEDTNQTVSDTNYFTTQASEYIFYLTELEGEARMSKLGITATHFSSKRKAKTWRDHISKVIHPDVCKHVHASNAMAQLNDLYNQMVGRE